MTRKNYKYLVVATSFVAAFLLANSNVLAKNEKQEKDEKVFKHIASLSVNGNSFTWAGPPALSHYTVSFCDGQTTGKIDINASDEVTTLSFDKQIAQVIGKGGQQYETVNASCVTEPENPQEETKPEPTTTPQDEPKNEPTQTSQSTGGSSTSSSTDTNSSPEQVLGATSLAYTGSSNFRLIAFGTFLFLLLCLGLSKIKLPKKKATIYHEGI